MESPANVTGKKEYHLNPWWLRATPLRKEFPMNVGVEGLCVIDGARHTYKSTTIRNRINSTYVIYFILSKF